MDYEGMGRRIRKLRKTSKYTQEQLSEKCGISPSFLGHIERGSRVASLDTFVKLCNTLHTSPSFLLQNDLDDYRPPMPEGISKEDYEKVCTIIRLALETIRGER